MEFKDWDLTKQFAVAKSKVGKIKVIHSSSHWFSNWNQQFSAFILQDKNYFQATFYNNRASQDINDAAGEVKLLSSSNQFVAIWQKEWGSALEMFSTYFWYWPSYNHGPRLASVVSWIVPPPISCTVIVNSIVKSQTTIIKVMSVKGVKFDTNISVIMNMPPIE